MLWIAAWYTILWRLLPRTASYAISCGVFCLVRRPMPSPVASLPHTGSYAISCGVFCLIRRPMPSPVASLPHTGSYAISCGVFCLEQRLMPSCGIPCHLPQPPMPPLMAHMPLSMPSTTSSGNPCCHKCPVQTSVHVAFTHLPVYHRSPAGYLIVPVVSNKQCWYPGRNV